MIKRKHFSVILIALAVALLMTMLGGCGRKKAADEPAVPATNTDPASQTESAAPAEPAAPAEAEVVVGRQDGERFEDIIILEGMEETVKYEHVRNGAIGFEMDYDYESFVRQSGSDRECFVSVWDDAANPENYLEVRYSPLDAAAAATAIGEILSNEFEISRDDAFMLGRAGSCIRIDASEVKGGGYMPDQLQMVYVIPAADGCRVATAHYAIEASEGFGRRFHYMMDTFSTVNCQESLSITGTWQTASMTVAEDGTISPEYDVQFTDSEILYGHMKDGQFAPDHSDRIVFFGKAASGGSRVQALASNGVQYTYQTCESDESVLEYFETWQEKDFPDMYRGGASLSKNG